MPVPITKYTCQFKCGTKAMSDKRKMEAHENNHCFRNPENHTCETCTNRIYESDYDDFQRWHVRGCKISLLNDFLDEVQEDLMVGTAKHIKPLWHCPSHNLTEAHPLTEIFINEVREKIEAKRLSIEESKKPFTLPF